MAEHLGPRSVCIMSLVNVFHLQTSYCPAVV